MRVVQMATTSLLTAASETGVSSGPCAVRASAGRCARPVAAGSIANGLVRRRCGSIPSTSGRVKRAPPETITRSRIRTACLANGCNGNADFDLPSLILRGPLPRRPDLGGRVMVAGVVMVGRGELSRGTDDGRRACFIYESNVARADQP